MSAQPNTETVDQSLDVEIKDPSQEDTKDGTKLPNLDMFGKVSSWFSSKENAVLDATSPVLEGAKSKVTSWFGSKDSATDEVSSPVLDGAKNKVASWFGSKDSATDEVSSPAIDGTKSKVTSWFSTEDQASPVTPVVEGAKSFGTLLYSAVNKAGQTVTEASVKLKKTVEESSILGEFNKEQESFIQEKQSNQTSTSAALPPWVGHPNEKQLKAACLELSKDRKNFTRTPPPGVDFEFDYATQYPVAMVTLTEDKQLETMRFELVPAVVNEANFWRNYFYRVSLISQANELSALEAEQLSSQLQTEPEDSESVEADVESSVRKSAASKVLDPMDFVSDSLDTKDQDLDEIREEMKKLGLSGASSAAHEGSSTTEEDWEKELDAEIQEFELVASEK